MADYTVWDINGLLPGEPWTSAKAIAAFENLNAFSECADDAPVGQAAWHPWNATRYGETDGVIYDHSTDGNVTFIETPVLDSAFQYALVWEQLIRASGVTDTQLTGSFRLTTTGVYNFAGLDLGDLRDGNIGQINSGVIILQPQVRARGMHSIIVQGRSLTTNAETISPPAISSDRTAAYWTGTATRIDRIRLNSSEPSGIQSGRAALFRRKWEGL